MAWLTRAALRSTAMDWAVAASVTFHLLAATMVWSPPRPEVATPLAAVAAQVMHLRLPLPDPGRTLADVSRPRQAVMSSVVDSTELPVPHRPVTTLAPIGEPVPLLSEPAPAMPAPPAPPMLRSAVNGYVLRQALTQPPLPLTGIELPWPAGWTSTEPQRGVFSLFIDEQGVVDAMVADGPSLLPALEASAREVFMAARFTPGEVDGVAVKALIRIEVVFDGRPTAVPGAVVVSRQNL